jgi:hypothetical protein
MKKLFLWGFALSLLLPAAEAATPTTTGTTLSTKNETIFGKRRRYKPKRNRGFLGLFRKKSGCGCPKN